MSRPFMNSFSGKEEKAVKSSHQSQAAFGAQKHLQVENAREDRETWRFHAKVILN